MLRCITRTARDLPWRCARTSIPIRLASTTRTSVRSAPDWREFGEIQESAAPQIIHDGQAEDTSLQRVSRRSMLKTNKISTAGVPNTNVKLFREVDSRGKRNAVEQLNHWLSAAAESPSSLLIRDELWDAYHRAKKAVPGLLMNVPDDAWMVLWGSYAADSGTDILESKRRDELFQDMLSLGAGATHIQRTMLIESLLDKRELKKAVSLWEEEYSSLASANKLPHYSLLHLGIRLYIHMGNLERAKAILEAMAEESTTWNPYAIFELMEGYINRNERGDDVDAWKLYRFLRRRLGADMDAEHFDACAILFLKNGQRDQALAVTADSALNAASAQTNAPRLDEEQTILRRTELLLLAAPDTQSANAISLAKLSILPRKLQNRVFFGAWIKRLIQAGEYWATTQVLELMYERGIKPDGSNMNGLISAWFSSGKEELVETALQTAWNMIGARMAYVRQRDDTSEAIGPPSRWAYDASTDVAEPKAQKRKPVWLERELPHARVEIFHTLALHYHRRRDYEKAWEVLDLASEAKCPPSTRLLNLTITLQIYEKKYGDAGDTFAKAVSLDKVDVATCNIMFTALGTIIDRSSNRYFGRPPPGFPSTRELLRHLLADRRVLAQFSTSAHTDPSRAKFSAKLYRSIVRCFFGSGDITGGLVALHAMNQLYNIDIDELVKMEVVKALAMGGLPAETRRRRRNTQSSVTFANSVDKVIDVARYLQRKRGKILPQPPGGRQVQVQYPGEGMVPSVDPDWDPDLTPQVVGKAMDLDVVSELVRTVLVRADSPEVVERAIDHAKDELGVPQLRTGAVDSFHVD